ncbi:hypothetical protein [Pseudovibrio sp. Ad26]|uniref:hypothetical protein n=1 Tax=Pseudovibrio sp. Ad26 TaxID=989410 RepID=UPI0007AE8E09|nr:hypothetical protein [Pseudovibrio sp. Ad26]KZL15559.1 hypothetical protein PsAD26_01110 [Pseudovibrio sp. Ad26]
MELLHSFLFRHQTKIGIQDTSNIFDPMGRWHRYPYVYPQTQQIFSKFEDAFLLDVLAYSNLLDRGHPHFETRFHNFIYNTKHITALNGLLYREQVSPQALTEFTLRRKITYCKQCIQADLKHNGFVTLPASWHSCTECQVHNIPLRYAIANSKTEAAKSLRAIMAGDDPNKYTEVSKDDSYSFHSDRVSNNNRHPLLSFCLLFKFNAWFLDNHHVLKGDWRDVFGYKKHEWKSHQAIKAQFGYETTGSNDWLMYTETLLSDLFENNYDALSPFFKKHAQKLEIFSGVRDLKKYSDIVWVPKKCPCKSCKFLGVEYRDPRRLEREYFGFTCTPELDVSGKISAIEYCE